MKRVETAGVVGAGTMGSALAQKFAQEGFRVVLVDREMKFVERGLQSISETLRDGVAKKVFSGEQAAAVLSRITASDKLESLALCDLVVEAIYEDFSAKSELFSELSAFLPAPAIVATNTSSFSVTELGTSVKDPERFIGLHYFYHAAKNRLVEIVPGKATSKETIQAARRFSALTGKDPIFTADTYGFAVNRFFVPWLNEAVRMLDEGVASMEEIDAVCMHRFGIGMGPFALMNATGIQVALHAQRTLEVFGPSYQPSALLEKQVSTGANWPVSDAVPEKPYGARESMITDRMLGSVYFVCSQILSERVCSAADLDRGARIGLRWKRGPVDLMRETGVEEVAALVESYARLYGEKPAAVSAAGWNAEFVSLEVNGDRAVITINRPEDLNAFNESVMKSLDRTFNEAEGDSTVKTIFITGSGKAFVAGADIRFFIDHIKDGTLHDIVEFTRYGQEVFDRIDRSSKKVVAVLNGLTLGGGLELALCADVIIAADKAVMAFPETGIGIYPGLGGTQRTAQRVGKGLAKYLILTGAPMKASDAFDAGLADAVMNAVEMFNMLDGSIPVPAPRRAGPTGRWKEIGALYDKNNYSAIMRGDHKNGTPGAEEVARFARAMSRKAPVAMRIADELIESSAGPASELERLTEVFGTRDALEGLSSMGRNVTYMGK